MEALRKSKLFCAMSEEEIREYLSKAAYQIRTFNRNAAIFPAGEPCKWVDILLEGRADCHRADEKGNLMLSAHYYPGDDMGAIIYFSHHTNVILPIVARTECTVLRMGEELLDILKADRRFSDGLITSLADRADEFVSKIERVMLKSVRGLVKDLLEAEYYRQRTVHLRLPASKKELAEQMGVQRQTLCREFKRLKDAGQIRFEGREFQLLEGFFAANPEIGRMEEPAQ